MSVQEQVGAFTAGFSFSSQVNTISSRTDALLLLNTDKVAFIKPVQTIHPTTIYSYLYVKQPQKGSFTLLIISSNVMRFVKVGLNIGPQSQIRHCLI